MILSKQAIQEAMQKGLIKITPFNEQQIENAHINLHLSGKEKLRIAPQQFVLTSTTETIRFASTICGFVEGRASLAKLGISCLLYTSRCV